MKKLTLGSLFSGSGGFEVAGILSGIEPIWNSEICPFPKRVTTKRLPQVHHYGDISKLNGAELPPVDIITFGSPCQDMSIAGRRAGLDGSRSNLFYEAIRIIKEMRDKTNGKYHTLANEEMAGTLVESDYKDPPVINDTDGVEYIVRRLTPSECAMLQGFPSTWCSDLGTENPTAEDIAYWREVFNEYNLAIGKKVKPKTDNQIIKWLKNPHSDSAEYALWGNGISLPVAVFVLSGITFFDKNEPIMFRTDVAAN